MNVQRTVVAPDSPQPMLFSPADYLSLACTGFFARHAIATDRLA